jgi:hypothetical protein
MAMLHIPRLSEMKNLTVKKGEREKQTLVSSNAHKIIERKVSMVYLGIK